MSSPFLGEIRLTPYNFAMRGWASCDGQLLPISQNNALFALIGTTYGGDGQSTFALPNLKSRIPVGQGNPPAGGSYQIGQLGGAETVTLSTSHLPAHTHRAIAVAQPTVGTTASPANSGWAGSALAAYSGNATPPLVAMAASALGSAGSAQPQPHDNRMPFPGSAGGCPPTPPQTRTSAIHASGSSRRGFATRRTSTRFADSWLYVRFGLGATGSTAAAASIIAHHPLPRESGD